MRQFYLLLIFCVSLTFPVNGQTSTTIATDNASSYTSPTWINGSNLGTGFEDWTISSSSGGNYIGGTGQGDPSFGLFSNGGGSFSYAERAFDEALQPGDTFSVDLGHTSTINGEIFVQFYDGATAVFTLVFIGGDDRWRLNDGGANFDSGQLYDDFASITFTFTYEGGNDYSYTFGTGSGSNFTAASTISNITSVRFQSTNQGSGENFGFNNLEITRPTYTTLQDGNYNDAAQWVGNDLPDLSNPKGRIEIKHNITLDTDITVDSELIIDAGQSLAEDATSRTITNNGNIILNSTSSSYSSLIVNSVGGSGSIEYNRFVNSNANGNDLVAPPLDGQSWADFLANGTNASDLFDDGNVGPTTYAFAPFDKTASDYVNYNSGTSATLSSGTGYRVATDAGTTLTFSGSIATGTITVPISDTGTAFATWNLIGNPLPSYLNVQDFLNNTNNNAALDQSAVAIYGYDGDASDGWDILNLATTSATDVITPGQGFFISAETTGNIEFTQSMRRTGNTDDFIAGRNSNPLTFAKINISTANDSYNTDIYFNANATLGLDPGYDAAIFGGTAPSFSIYSHLVEENTGDPIALQTVGLIDLSDVTIPLGVNANQGEQLTFSIVDDMLPSSVDVYLDDTVANTSILLNATDYVLTPTTALSSTGRFYIRFVDNALSISDDIINDLRIYTNQERRSINIAGQVDVNTTASVYDIQGRLMVSTSLNSESTLQVIDATTFNTGIYLVQLSDGNRTKTEKIILK